MPQIGFAPSDAFIQLSGSLALIPSGSPLVGNSQSAGERQIIEISMSANANNYHTPVNNTASFFNVSGSTLADHFYTIAYTTPEIQHQYRIITAPNSASDSSSYGSQGSKFFEFTASRQGYVAKKFRLYYTNPPVFHRASGSVTITSFSSSQDSYTGYGPGGPQYKFFLSGSGGKVFEFIPSQSLNSEVPFESINNGLTWPFEFFYTSSISQSINNFDGVTESIIFYQSSSREQGVQAIADIINRSASYFGVSATASLQTLTFNAVNTGPLSTPFAFITQSLTNHSTLKTFSIGGGAHVTSSSPGLGGNDFLIQVPIAFTASAFNIATASRDVINSPLHVSSSFISASVSGSDGDLYGLIITSRKPQFFPDATGSTNPTFTFTALQTGSKNILPTLDSRVSHIIEVEVSPTETAAGMISASIEQINNYVGGIYLRPGFDAGAGPTGSLDQNSMYISASYCNNPNAFRLTNKIVGAVNQPDMANARTTASIIQSGSGVFAQQIIYGNYSLNDASMQMLKDNVDNASFILSGSKDQSLYFSGSGDKIGFNTNNPEKEIDFRADEFQFQRKAEQKGLRINRFGDLESFNFDAASAATGSELVLKYQRGGAGVLSVAQAAEAASVATGIAFGSDNQTSGVEFENQINAAEDEGGFDGNVTEFINSLDPKLQAITLDVAKKSGFFEQGAAGDVIGSVRFVVASGSRDEEDKDRGAGEAAVIKSVIKSVDNAAGGVTSRLSFSVAKLTGNRAVQLLNIDPSQGVEISSSLVMQNGSSIHLGGANTDGTDRRIDFRHATAPFQIGVDDSRNRFAIHSAANNFNSSGVNDFEIDNAGAVTINNGLTLNNTFAVAQDAEFNGNITGDGSTNITGINRIETAGNIQVNHPGIITASTLNISDDAVVTDLLTVGRIRSGGGHINLQGSLTGITDITASRHITASGHIESERIINPTIAPKDGTNANATLKINASSVVYHSRIDFAKAGTTQWVLGSDATSTAGSNDFRIIKGTALNNANGLFITASNYNVGIGTLKAVEKLTVAGNISASGQIFSNTYYQWEATARCDTDDDTNWQGPNSKGLMSNEDWAQDYGTDYDGTSDNAESRLYMNTGWWIPHGANYSASVKSMDIYVQPNSNITHADDDFFSCSLWYSRNSDLQSELNHVDTNAGTFVQRHGASVDSSQCKASDDKFFKYNNYHVSQSISLDLAPGSMLFPRIKTGGTNNFNTNVYWVIHYCKKPL